MKITMHSFLRLYLLIFFCFNIEADARTVFRDFDRAEVYQESNLKERKLGRNSLSRSYSDDNNSDSDFTGTYIGYSDTKLSGDVKMSNSLGINGYIRTDSTDLKRYVPQWAQDVINAVTGQRFEYVISGLDITFPTVSASDSKALSLSNMKMKEFIFGFGKDFGGPYFGIEVQIRPTNTISSSYLSDLNLFKINNFNFALKDKITYSQAFGANIQLGYVVHSRILAYALLGTENVVISKDISLVQSTSLNTNFNVHLGHIEERKNIIKYGGGLRLRLFKGLALTMEYSMTNPIAVSLNESSTLISPELTRQMFLSSLLPFGGSGWPFSENTSGINMTVNGKQEITLESVKTAKVGLIYTF